MVKDPRDLKLYYLSTWRSQVSDRLHLRRLIETFANSFRRKIYAKAWSKFRALIPKNQSAPNDDIEPNGIGGALLSVAETKLKESLSITYALVEDIVGSGSIRSIKLLSIGWSGMHQPTSSVMTIELP